MKLTVRRNFKFANIVDGLIDESAMREAGNELATKIKERTLRGLDEDGRRFEPTESGAPADLHASGRLLDDLGVVEASNRRVVVGFRTERSRRIAGYLQHGTSNMPARPFLGVPARWAVDILRRLVQRRGR
jgi:hypothetical protein